MNINIKDKLDKYQKYHQTELWYISLGLDILISALGIGILIYLTTVLP